MNTTIELPISKSLKKQAEAASRWYGFSSLTEALEALIQKLSHRELILPKKEKVVRLSAKNEKRYTKIVKDIEAGRNIYKPKNTEEFFEMLES